MTALRPVLDALPGLEVLVVGDALLDDSFTTAFALTLAAGGDATVAAEVAQAAAAVVTRRDGTCTCSLDDLREHLAETTTRLEDTSTVTLIQRIRNDEVAGVDGSDWLSYGSVSGAGGDAPGRCR